MLTYLKDVTSYAKRYAVATVDYLKQCAVYMVDNYTYQIRSIGICLSILIVMYITYMTVDNWFPYVSL